VRDSPDNDTSGDAEPFQLELLRRAGPQRRSALASALTNQALERAHAGIARAHPDMSELDRRLLFVEIHYGIELAERVREFLRTRPGSPASGGDLGMNRPDFEAFFPIAEALESMGVGYFIGGSVASSAHGVVRSTLDIDVIAALPETRAGEFAQRLGDAYHVDIDTVRDAIRRRSSFNLIHLATRYKIDVFVQRARDCDQAAAGRAVKLRVFGEQAREFPVVSPEDSILSKLDWYLIGGESSQRQWADIVGLPRSRGASLDLEYLHRWAKTLRLEDLLAQAMRHAADRRSPPT